jgi:DNA-binding winged helix-turn-helix (wHTH) protein
MVLAFADCILDSNSRQLSRGGAVVPLEPKMYALLEVLIARRPAVVTYAELDEILWPKVYVTRTSLTRLVSELRTLLGDSAGDGQIIRTAYKTGYAFAAGVTAAGVTAAARSTPTRLSLQWNERLLPLSEGENLAGRGSECALVIDATSVSRRHARITVSGGAATLEDLGSTNGTFVNDAPISSPTLLRSGDVIVMGKAVMRLRAFDPAAPTEITLARPSRAP